MDINSCSSGDFGVSVCLIDWIGSAVQWTVVLVYLKV